MGQRTFVAVLFLVVALGTAFRLGVPADVRHGEAAGADSGARADGASGSGYTGEPAPDAPLAPSSGTPGSLPDEALPDDALPSEVLPSKVLPSEVLPGVHGDARETLLPRSDGAASSGVVPGAGDGSPPGRARQNGEPSETAVARPLAPVYRSAETVFGVALSSTDGSIPEALATNDALFGRLPVVRQFEPGLPPVGAWSRRGVLADRMVVHSFRRAPQEIVRGVHDDAITAFFAQAPTRQPIFFSYWHEPEPDIAAGRFSTEQYRAAFRHVVELVATTGKENLYPTLILTGWTADPASGRDWRDYSPGDDHVSVLAWDPYNGAHGNPDRYRSPEDVFGHVVRVSTEAGKPFGIAETGSALVDGDDGHGRAEWLRRAGEYLERQGAAFVTYFQSTRDGDFKLRDEPSVQAWARHVRRSSR